MKRKVLFLLLILGLLAVPAAVLANKRLYKAQLSGANENPPVDTDAGGSAVFGRRPHGIDFMVQMRDLSGPPTGVHLHGPATPGENASILVSLCGNPGPAAVATCDYDYDANSNSYRIDGTITSSLMAQWGLTNAVFDGYLNDSLVYINVHTALHPAGEARGQLIPQ